VSDRKDIWLIKTGATYPQQFSCGSGEGKELKGNWLTQIHLENCR